jgi:DMSO/TMAO reductase YedYZ molybdopterin-dependent catalytic subunit
MEKRRIGGSAVIIALVILAAMVIAALIFGGHSTVKLASVEVREYNGTRLSSVNDFRENSIDGPQYINISDYHLEISGLVENPKNYSYEEVIGKQNYEKEVTLNCVEGWDVTILWKGILVSDLLKEVKPTGDANTVIFYAYDGYSVNFPIDYFNKSIIMAYEMNNVTIPPERGYPFMLVSEDKWGYKWIKWITKIEVTNDTNYKGYWESRGYTKEGNLNESFYS